ncbi:MAG: ABC transporter permease [Spirochaetales bacterium]|nr:MAG: ABC transporter permease [Spirochaetales bacterium]
MKTAATIQTGKRQSKITQSLVLVGLIILLCIVSTIVNPRFINPNNIINIFSQISILGIVASGIGMLLISGEIDISAGTQISLMGVILSMIIQKLTKLPEGSNAGWLTPYAIPLAVVATFAAGALMGFINGITVIKSRAASFIVTLGFSSVYHGVALLVTGGASYILYGQFELLGRGKLFGFLPVSILFFIGSLVLAFIILKYTKYGRFLYALGGNKKAAYVSGINTTRVTLTAYITVGLLNALAALILISRVGSALSTTGDAYSLDSLASVIVGGIALTGGRGTALSIFLGCVLIGLIGNALVIMNVNPYLRDVVIGLIIIGAVTIGQLMHERE